MGLEVKAIQTHRVVLEDVDTSEDFTVGAAIEALQQSGRIPPELCQLARKDLALVVFRPNDSTCLVPSQAQTWSSLLVQPEDSILLLPRHEEAMSLLQHESAAEVSLMTELKKAQDGGLLSEEEFRVLIRIARDEHHPLHRELRHIHTAFSSDVEDLVTEVRDLLHTSGASSLAQGHSHQQQGPPHHKQQHRQRAQGESDLPKPQRRNKRLFPATSQPPQHDIMWILSTLIIAFFSFMAMMTHLFFIKDRYVFLGPIIHGLAGLLALYEVFGCRSLLGYDPIIHTIGHAVRDFLLVAFTFNACLDIYTFSTAPQLAFSGLSTNFFGVLVTLVWLIALRFSWKTAPEADSVMALTLALMTLFCTSVMYNLAFFELTAPA